MKWYAWQITTENGEFCCGGYSPTESGATWRAQFNAQFFKEPVKIEIVEVEE